MQVQRYSYRVIRSSGSRDKGTEILYRKIVSDSISRDTGIKIQVHTVECRYRYRVIRSSGSRDKGSEIQVQSNQAQSAEILEQSNDAQK